MKRRQTVLLVGESSAFLRNLQNQLFTYLPKPTVHSKLLGAKIHRKILCYDTEEHNLRFFSSITDSASPALLSSFLMSREGALGRFNVVTFSISMRNSVFFLVGYSDNSIALQEESSSFDKQSTLWVLSECEFVYSCPYSDIGCKREKMDEHELCRHCEMEHGNETL